MTLQSPVAPSLCAGEPRTGQGTLGVALPVLSYTGWSSNSYHDDIHLPLLWPSSLRPEPNCNPPYKRAPYSYAAPFEGNHSPSQVKQIFVNGFGIHKKEKEKYVQRKAQYNIGEEKKKKKEGNE